VFIPWLLIVVGVSHTDGSARAQTGGPSWNLRVTGAHTVQVVMTARQASAEFGSDAVARLVPAPGGVLPSVELATESGRTGGGDIADMVSFGQPAVAAGVEVVPLIVRRPDGSGGKGTGEVRLHLTYDRPVVTQHGRGEMGRRLGAELGLSGQDGGREQTGYLIIVPDDFYSSILPLAAWKERKGLGVWVRRLSETGSTKEQIRAFIAGAYATWEPCPSYVLLVGAVNKIPAFITGGTPCVTDHSYACVDGDDYLADLYVGRLPAANVSELDCMVAKTVGYEMTPYVADTSWYHRALMVGTSYQEGGTPAVTALVTNRWLREYLLGRGFNLVDTIFYPPTRYGRGPVDTAVNRGVLFINGRGWGNSDGWGYPQFLINDVYGLANNWMLPVVTSIYCGTGNFQRNPCFGEAWVRAGTPTNPKGAVAFWGSSYSGTSTRWNNCMAYAIYRAVFDHGVQTCAQAMYAGKLAQLGNFPLPGDSFDLRLYFHVYNLLGDPSLEMWTGVPRGLAVAYPGSIPAGTSSFEVEVRDGASMPVSGALVSLLCPGHAHVVSRTGLSGRARFVLPGTVADSLLVTVTGPNLAPHLGRVEVVSSPVFVGHLEHSPAEVGPGSVDLSVVLKNYGTSQTAAGVRAVLRALDGAASVSDSARDYGDIGPGSVANASPFGVAVAGSCTSRQVIPLSLSVTSGGNTWESGLELAVVAPTLKTSGHTVHDANGVLEPGETAELSVKVRNTGRAAASGLVGVLRSLNPSAVAVLDSVGSFGDLAPGESVANSGDRFVVRADGAIGIGRAFTVRLVMRSGSVEQVWDFPVTVGQSASTTPLGPDRHGYYAYDDVDAGYSERPEFNWVEIDPNHGGSGTRVNLSNDTSVPVQLPFTFRFYGREYNTVSVCDNGFLAMGSTWLGDAYNWTIPSPMGPNGMVAVFWDDFRTDTMGASGVYRRHDASNHRFIVQWSRCVHMHGFRPPYPAEQQTFQVLLYDPQYHPTKTGDGPIVVQYLEVYDDDTLPNNNHNYATVGIQSPCHNDGLECTFAGARPAAAGPIVPGRAIRFTTNPPDTFTAVEELRQTPEARRMMLEVCPNPARGSAVLRLLGTRPGLSDNPVMSLRVFDSSGRLILHAAICNLQSEMTLDLCGLSPGVYCLVLTNRTDKCKLLSNRLVVLD